MASKVRDKIIDTASELFYSKGYNLTGINEIIERAGIAKATLYSHFRAKEELLLAYLDAKDQKALQQLKAFIHERPVGKTRLLAVLEFVLEFFGKADFHGCWCVRTVAEIPPEKTEILDKIRENKSSFRDFLEELVRENKPELEEEACSQMASQLYVLYEGALTESHLHNADWPIKSALALFESVLQRT